MTDQPPRVGECAICLQPLEGQLCSLPCGHIFHDACIRFIEVARPLCPACRTAYNVGHIRPAYNPIEYLPPPPRWNREFLADNPLTEIFKEVDRRVTAGAPGYRQYKETDWEYRGQVDAQNRASGLGVLISDSGHRCEGEFVAGLHHGYGVYRWDCGDVYEGSFRDKDTNGWGIYRARGGTVEKGWSEKSVLVREDAAADGWVASLRNGVELRWRHHKEVEEREAKHKEQLEKAIRKLNEDLMKNKQQTERKLKTMQRDNNKWKRKLAETTKKLEETTKKLEEDKENERLKKAEKLKTMQIDNNKWKRKLKEENERLMKAGKATMRAELELMVGSLQTRIQDVDKELQELRQQRRQTPDGDDRGVAEGSSSSRVNGEEQPSCLPRRSKRRKRG